MMRLTLASLLVSILAVAARASELLEASIPELQRAMEEGPLTSRELVEIYLARIEAYDRRDPALRSLVFVNPRAREEADALDRERAERGPRGPLHGIPVILKDNFDTFDMPTAGGSIALAGFRPADDGFQVRKLREAGAVFLGKSNMHELARGITTISSLGGQTRNPYDARRNAGGSSGGTAAAVAARFAAVGMGSDTCGSIRIPAAHTNLFGLRVTQGLSSRDGIIPLSHTQDVAGPLARSTLDLALVLDATVGFDPADPSTEIARGKIPETYTAFLEEDALRGARVGILNALFGDQPEDEEVSRVIRSALGEMEAAGAVLVETEIPDLDALLEDVYVVLRSEFKFDLDEYLRTSGAPVRSLGDILEKGLYHAALAEPFRSSNAVPSLDTDAYRRAFAQREVIRKAVRAVMDEERLAALVYPTIRRKAARIGDPQHGSNCLLSATSGLPAMSVPAGFTEDGLPVGMELLGRDFAEPDLIRIAYAFEQATAHRRPPATTPPLVDGGPPPPLRIEAVARGDEHVPAVSSAASARAVFRYDAPRQTLEYEVSVAEPAAGDVLFAFIHQGKRGENGPAVLTVSGEPFVEASGVWALDGAIREALLEGALYLSVSTRSHPTGELRAQLEPAPAREGPIQ